MDIQTKNELLSKCGTLAIKTRKGNAAPEHTHALNAIINRLYTLGLDIRGIRIPPEAHTIVPPGLRHADERTPLSAEERARCLVDGNMFRDRLEEVIRQIETYRS